VSITKKHKDTTILQNPKLTNLSVKEQIKKKNIYIYIYIKIEGKKQRKKYTSSFLNFVLYYCNFFYNVKLYLCELHFTIRQIVNSDKKIGH